MSIDIDDWLFEEVLGDWEGAVDLEWEVASRCTCYSEDSHQPSWRHDACGGLGVLYGPKLTTRGLFRSRSQWLSFRAEGELERGEATLTLPLAVRPTYIDRRVRDRFSVVAAVDDPTRGRVFMPAAMPVPFVFGGRQRAWRVQVQLLAAEDRLGGP